jgi:hypothetical protein
MNLTIKKIIINVEAPTICEQPEPATARWLGGLGSSLPFKFKTVLAPAIGQEWPEQGGVYAGVMRAPDGKPHYHMIVPTSPDTQTESIKWGTQNVEEADAKCDRDGLVNTLALVTSANEYPAAQWAHGLQIGAFNDFYLPSRRELRLLWVNVPELFADGYYWSSTQYSRNDAWCQYFSGGSQGYDDKDDELRARAVRRLLID